MSNAGGSFGRVKRNIEGAPIHPGELDWLCGCGECMEAARRQGLAYYKYLMAHGEDLAPYHNDLWFPKELK